MSSLSGVRPRRNLLELTTGFLVLAALAALLALAVLGRSQGGHDGYALHAVFNQIDGLSVGSDVRLAGITVGHVTSETVDPKSFRADVSFTVRDGIALPTDSAAIVTSDSLLGGKYIALSPGGDEKNLTPGAVVSQTQGAISLEQLLSKFIFSVTDSLDKSRKAATP
ncbi:outer membrane lipid asymmetry maintenance protein MlaD [Asaia astilbis]|uniref:outer membrane lipid asymmetry maintenance protein MlaD n=1 Tax=Asaia astilbis TaxID=610244 RepID=UPI0004717D82|nr:outer membrane lipid asymmetry maintenance protein MlaD [Asaia astilbis]